MAARKGISPPPKKRGVFYLSPIRGPKGNRTPEAQVSTPALPPGLGPRKGLFLNISFKDENSINN